MKLACHRSLLAGLVGAAMSMTATSGYAQSAPTVQSPAPGIGKPPAARSVPPPEAGARTTAPPVDVRQNTLAECMSFWDAATHMTKAEWREACKRTRNGRLY